jgi:hypothetical protein
MAQDIDKKSVVAGGSPDDKQLTEAEQARRDMLRKAALGTGAVVTAPVWVKPVVNTVIIPAHAQMSGATTTASSTMEV